MPIEGFDYKAFAKNLSEQVGPALPPEISDPDKQYIINIVFNFCYMAGEALSNDPNLNFTADQASIVTQFIGEWAFHKSIDIIKGGIDPQFRDAIMQKIAFTVFEIAKTAIIKNMPQADMIAVVELQVKKAYHEALEELKKNGALTEEQVKEAESHSNIDEMAQAAAEEQAQQNPAQSDVSVEQQSYVNQTSDNKLLKLATFAIILRRLPESKRQNLLNQFNPEDAQILADYASMDDLENKLDRGLIVKCLQEIKRNLPVSKKFNAGKVNEKLYKIVTNSNISQISNIIRKERNAVKSFVMGAAEGRASDMPPRIADVICTHLEEKIKR